MSNLILGRGPCPRPTIEIGIEMPVPRYQGIMRWELIRKGIIIRHGEMKNLITDAGLNAMNGAKIQSLTNFVGVGTSSTAPANGQTDLVAPVFRINRGTTGDQSVTSGPSFDYWSLFRVHLILEAEGNGNLTEVGYFDLGAAGTMFSRQLFKDTFGVPTTVVKTAADQLKITYEIRLYTATADNTQLAVTISGTNYDIVSRAREIDNSLVWGLNTGAGLLQGPAWAFGVGGGNPGGRALESNVLGTRADGISGASVSKDTAVVAAYSTGNFYRDVTSKWEPATANFATGIGGIHNYGGDTTECFQVSFTPKFAKDGTKRLTLVTRWSWARYP